jgi:hypothetical protein
MSGQTAIDVNASGAAGAQTVGIFNGGPNGSIGASGNSGPQIIGSGTNGVLTNSDLATLLVGSLGTPSLIAFNMASDIYSQFAYNSNNNPIAVRTTQFANPGAFGAG